MDSHRESPSRSHSLLPNFLSSSATTMTSTTTRVLRRRRPLLLLTLLLSLIYYLFARRPATSFSLYSTSPPTRDAKNWGEYIAFGHGREQFLARTDPTYPGLGDNHLFVPSSGSSTGGKQKPGMLEGMKRSAGIIGDSEFEKERHGMYGGGNWDWSTGVAGAGTYLGPLDMRKLSAIPSPPSLDTPSEDPQLSEGQRAAVSHYLSNAWTVADANEQHHYDEILQLPISERISKNLPLRDIALGNTEVQQEAAEMWTRTYTAGQGVVDTGGKVREKSALEDAVEKMVRRAGVVVVGKGGERGWERCREVLGKLRLSPEVLYIDVDKRPDGKNLAALLVRRTLHETLPNVIIGGRSIGGLVELEALSTEEGGKRLLNVLEHAGVKSHGVGYRI